jgi:ABC-2 type transport system permease protein
VTSQPLAAPAPPRLQAPEAHSTLPGQFKILARRSLAKLFRDPANIAPGVIIPILLYLVISAGLKGVTKIKGFPTDSYPTFALAIPFVQGAMLAMTTAGQTTAIDIESGFINRLALTPMRGAALITAQLTGPMALAVIEAGAYFGIGLALGVHVAAGVAGALVLVALFLVSCFGFGAMGIFIGLRTGSTQAIQAALPLTTVFLFLSSANFPRNLVKADWFRWIAEANPITYLVEGMRSLLIVGWDKQALALGFGVAGALAISMLAASAFTLRRRLVRT